MHQMLDRIERDNSIKDSEQLAAILPGNDIADVEFQIAGALMLRGKLTARSS